MRIHRNTIIATTVAICLILWGMTQVCFGATGTVTQANMRISAVDGGATPSGGAFVDFSTAGTLVPYVGQYLKVYDSTGKTIEGWIKAAGTGETLSGSELIANPGFETVVSAGPPANFTTWAEAVGTGGNIEVETTSIKSGTNAAKYTKGSTPNYSNQIFSMGALKLNKISLWTRGDGTYAGAYQLDDQTHSVTMFLVATGITSTTYTQVTRYFTVPSGCSQGNFYVGGTTGGVIYWDDISVQQVLTPSTSGVTIVSTSGGTTYNWAVQTSGFNYNDTTYTYTITPAAAMAGYVAAGALQADLTTTNAFVGGIDVSAYRGYKLRIYSGTTLYAEGRISMTAPGNTLGDELVTLGDFSAGTGWSGPGWGIAGGIATGTTTSSSLYRADVATVTTQKLYKVVYDLASRTAGTTNVLLANVNLGVSSSTPATITQYLTATATDTVSGIRGQAFSGTIDNLSIKNVTSPAATGALLLSDITGARGYTYLHPSMTGNGAYTYEIIGGGRVTQGQTALLTSGTIAAGSALMDTSTANAFGAPTGVDFSPYRTGKHKVKFTNTSGGGTAWAYIGATAPENTVTDIIGGTDPALNNGDFEVDEPAGTAWARRDTGWVITGGLAVATSAAHSTRISQNLGTLNALIKATIVIASCTGGAFRTVIGTTNGSDFTSGTGVQYTTQNSVSVDAFGIAANGVTSGTLSSVTFQRITSPAVTGALLCSNTAGTRGFISKDTAFDPNAALVVTIYSGGTATISR